MSVYRRLVHEGKKLDFTTKGLLRNPQHQGHVTNLIHNHSALVAPIVMASLRETHADPVSSTVIIRLARIACSRLARIPTCPRW